MIDLPRGYLSWSQLNLWETSKRSYKKSYFEGKPFFETKEMRFGKKFAETCENRDLFGLEENWRKVFEKLEIYPENEFEVEVRLFSFDVKLFGKIDTLKIGYGEQSEEGAEVQMDIEFREYKTGKVEWTQERADNHGQLYFYCLMLKNKYGSHPDVVHLDWAETENVENKINLTGKLKTFEVKIDPKKLLEMEERIVKASEEISEAFEDFKENGGKPVNVNMDLIREFEKLDVQRRGIDAKQKELKEKIQADFIENKAEEFCDDVGSFYFIERKKYEYSEDLKKLEKEYKDAKKKEERTAKFETKKIFSFRAK